MEFLPVWKRVVIDSSGHKKIDKTIHHIASYVRRSAVVMITEFDTLEIFCQINEMHEQDILQGAERPKAPVCVVSLGAGSWMLFDGPASMIINA